MRILVVSQYWWPENGVPQRRWSWLTSVLRDAGHEVLVVSPPPHYQRRMSAKDWFSSGGYRSAARPEPGPNGETIVRTGFVPGGSSITAKVVNQVGVAAGMLTVLLAKRGPLRSFSPDVVIGTVPSLPTAAVAQFASRIFRVPYVIDLRDAWPELLRYSGEWNKGTGRTSIRERVLKRGPLQFVLLLTEHVMRLSLKSAGAVIVTSDKHKRYLRRELLAQKVYTVRNVFPSETQPHMRTRGERDNDKQSLRVLYAGTIGRAQHLANALTAAGIAQVQGLDVQLRFIGTGAEKAELQRMAERRGLNCRFEERRKAESLAEAYEWADTALVHLTDWKPLERAVPSKTYELMSAGIHISAAIKGEAAELIQDLRAGDIVPPEDPNQLAALWIDLARNPHRLNVDPRGRNWVEKERHIVAPSELKQCLDSLDFEFGARND